MRKCRVDYFATSLPHGGKVGDHWWNKISRSQAIKMFGRWLVDQQRTEACRKGASGFVRPYRSGEHYLGAKRKG